MRTELIPFQRVALGKLRQTAATALGNYRSTHTPQVICYSAPTGAGKTIIMSALIEAILFGYDQYADQRDAIFVWLSDSPQLNEQSKQKIELQADKMTIGQCVTIEDDSFDRETLADGHVYFLNIQKLSKSSNLTKHSDGRQYTIWETLANTALQKPDKLYFIIDEAHRGAKLSEGAKNTTIMQKFLRGSAEDGLPPMPVVIGMTATPARFNRLIQGISGLSTHTIETKPAEVRMSGLLKDRIVIAYPESNGNEMAVLQAATDEWLKKCEHWHQYCEERHYAQVNPIFVIQVQNGNKSMLSQTDLDECLNKIEERMHTRLMEGQVVHAFGETNETLVIHGLNVPYCEPSAIADSKRIKIVFFKETLSTGWDCPRAEAMMSFRAANDDTWIAQLLGRMVRTPMRSHIEVDDTLNDVHLFLPYFDPITVENIVKALQDVEGAEIPADVISTFVGTDTVQTLGLTPTYKSNPHKYVQMKNGQISMFEPSEPEEPQQTATETTAEPIETPTPTNTVETPATPNVQEPQAPVIAPDNQSPVEDAPTATTQGNAAYVVKEFTDAATAKPVVSFDRLAVARAINDAGLLTYDVRHTVITDYVKSMFDLAWLLTKTRIDFDARTNILTDCAGLIADYIHQLKIRGQYAGMAADVMEFKLTAQYFNVFGETLENYESHDIFTTTDEDIDRQFRLAEGRLTNNGVGNAYVTKNLDKDDLVTLKTHVIIFAANVESMNMLHQYATDKFHELNDTYRRRTTTLPEKDKRAYDRIVSDGDVVSKHNFRLPEKIHMSVEDGGMLYYDHLFVDDSGAAVIKLNGWESDVIKEEQTRDDFVCWIRNASRASWSLCIPYSSGAETKPFYPDFIIIRQDDSGYIVDVLEPHDPTRQDNLGKAKGLAEYARQNPGVGRIQLIRMKNDVLGNKRPFRLDMGKSAVREKVMNCINNNELDHLFDTDGFSY